MQNANIFSGNVVSDSYGALTLSFIGLYIIAVLREFELMSRETETIKKTCILGRFLGSDRFFFMNPSEEAI